MPSKTQRFRQLIEAEEILIQFGVYDGFSARLAKQMGIKSADELLTRDDIALVAHEVSKPLAVSMEQCFLPTAQRQAKHGSAAA